jgi:hypothetical protein
VGFACVITIRRFEQAQGAMTPGISRTVVAGIAGGIAFCVGTFVTFFLIGSGPDQSGPLSDPSRQSAKVIAVFTTIEPLPASDVEPVVPLFRISRPVQPAR